MSIRKSIVILALSGVAAVAGITYGLSGSTSYRGVRTGFADENYLKSRDCRTCHEAADALGGSSASPPPDPLWAGPFLLEAFSDRSNRPLFCGERFVTTWCALAFRQARLSRAPRLA